MTNSQSTVAKGIMFTKIGVHDVMTCPVSKESLAYFNECYRAKRGHDEILAQAYEYAYDAISHAGPGFKTCTIYKHRFAMACERRGISRRRAHAAWARFQRDHTNPSPTPHPDSE